MVGCKHCRKTVAKFDKSQLRDDDICFVCGAGLMEVRASLAVRFSNWWKKLRA